MVKKVKPKKKVHRTKSGRRIFPEKMRLFALIQADDFEQWIAAQVKAQSTHEAVILFNKYYGYPDSESVLVDRCLTGTDKDKYLRLVELGGMNLPFIQALEPEQVSEVCGLYSWDNEEN